MKALKTPCDQCPFRKDCGEGWLGEKRIREYIEDSVMGDEYFVCHKTYEVENRLCAGKLILEEKVNPWGNFSTRIAKAVGFFDGYESLKGKDLIFDSAKECIEHHKH